MLLEYNLALELHERGLIEHIYPVLIGDLKVNTKSGYFKSGCHSDLKYIKNVRVESTVNKLSEQLRGLSLGSHLWEEWVKNWLTQLNFKA